MRRYYLFVLLLVSILFYAHASNKQGNSQDQQLSLQIIEEMELVDASLPQINLLRKQGEKNQARALAEKMLKQMEKIEADRKRLSQMGKVENEEVPSLAEIQEKKQYLTNRINLLRYTCLYIRCESDLFGEEYATFCEDVQNKLSGADVSFVENPETADWTSIITAKARQANKADFGGVSTYFAYVDVTIIITRTATGQRLHKSVLTEKGGHTHNFVQAAREAYRSVAPKISDIIKQQIQQ